MTPANLLPSPVPPDTGFLLGACQALARPQAPEALLRTFIGLLRAGVPARTGVLEWRTASGWSALAGFGPAGEWAGAEPGAGSPPDAASPTAPMREALLADPRSVVVEASAGQTELGLALLDEAGQPPAGVLVLQGVADALQPADPQVQALRWVGQQLVVALRAAWSVQALQDELGRQKAALAAEQQERSRAERVAAGALQRKTEFLAQMSQEIRAPMSAILGMSHLALRSGLNPQQHDYLRKVERSAESLLGLVNDVLDYSRIEAGKLEIERAPFRLGEVLDDLSSVVIQKAEEKGIELLFALPAGLPEEMVGDPARLGQVLVNLVGNAIKFTEQGQVVLRVQAVQRNAHSARLRFEVHDSGEGLTPEQHARLFMPLPQAELGPARGHAGPGLGLVISRHLVQLMGGEIHARSGPGPGSTFEFLADFGLPEGAGQVAAPAALPRGTRLLVVDDNEASRHILVDLGQQLGCEVEAVRDGWDAMRAVSVAKSAGKPFHLALLDWRMPGMDGVACARQLARSHPETALLMSTSGGHEALTQALKAQSVGVRSILPKPVTLRQLHEAASSVLAASREGCAAPAPRQPSVQLPAHLRGARLLLVEDNPINQEMALEVLQGAGLAVTVVDNGLKALAVMEQERFDAVLMDCQMPVMDGYEATREMRRKPRWARLPIIALTAASSPAERERALGSGMNDLVAKPFQADALIQAVARWVQPLPSGQPPALQAAKVPPGDPLTRLYGIDSQSALTAMGGNVGLYRRLLLKFHAANHDFGAKFRAARDSGDDEGARRLAHDLRGISGSLGARELHRAAAILENACVAAQPGESLEMPLAELLKELEPVMSSLQSLASA